LDGRREGAGMPGRSAERASAAGSTGYWRALSSLLKLALSLGLLAFVLNRIGWQQTLQALSQARIPYLIAALVLYLASIVVRAARWRFLVSALDMQLSLARLTQLYFVGAFFSTFLPTGVGGDIVRVYEVAQQSEKAADAVGTVLLDRAAGLLVLLLMAFVSLAFRHSLVGTQIAAAIVLLTVGGWGSLVLLMRRDLLERLGWLRLVCKIRQLEEVYNSVHACGVTAIGRALAMSLMVNLMLITMNVFIAWALGVQISLWYFFLFVPIISALLILPVSMSGLGVREGAYVYLFAQAGVLSSRALIMSLIVHVINMAAGLVGGILYALQGASELRSRSAD
jgi:uncharacterized protein (TIRG00374 family)